MKLIDAARRAAVRRAWAQERRLLKEKGITTLELTAAEKKELLKTGKVKGWEGHHINSVNANNLEMAMNPDNIKFVKGREPHLQEHAGNWQNPTSGALIDRLSQLSGPALLVFFLTYDKAMKKLAEESPVVSDPDSWESYINPANYLVENIALLEAIAAADRAQREYEKEKREEEEQNSNAWWEGWGAENQGPPR
jgi:hypothetical protein